VKRSTNHRKIIALLLILQCLLYVLVGVQKSYIHMDEAYSLGLASYDKVEIQANEDFYNQWHKGEYYEDYLSLQPDEKGSFSQVYENQKNDVHPPFYYLLLRLGMEFDGGHFNKWPGIIINILIYVFITLVMYLIVERILRGKENGRMKAIILAFMSSATIATLTNVIYIRMYALATLFVVLTAYLHMRLYEEDKGFKNVLFIGLVALVGSLTHYYYLFFLFALGVMFTVRYIRNKKYIALLKYIGVLIVAGAVSLAIFPHSITHMFFGYRGQGFIEKLFDLPSLMGTIGNYTYVIVRFMFSDMLIFSVIALLIIRFRYSEKVEMNEYKNYRSNGYLKIITIPTLFYAIIVGVASPWQDLRYMLPVCGFIFIIGMYFLYSWAKSFMSEKRCNKLFSVIFALMFFVPTVLCLEPQVAYTEKKEIVDRLENDSNVPALYVLKSSQNRFLDDILLFAKLDESYIASDFEYTQENIKRVFEGKDISNGVYVFINPRQNNEKILRNIKHAVSLNEHELVDKLNACYVYYLK